MIIPHLLLAHFTGDYLLQTQWIASRKSHWIDGLLIHTGIILVVSLLAVSPYLAVMLPYILGLYVIHTLQDWGKARFNHNFPQWLTIGYFVDQTLHIGLILIIQMHLGDHPDIAISNFELFGVSFATVIIIMTRVYEVSWWSNWFEMIFYMQQWQIWGYLERSGMVVVSMVGGVWLAPLLALPRLYWGYRIESPIWQTRSGLLEWGLGIVLSMSLGYIWLAPLFNTWIMP